MKVKVTLCAVFLSFCTSLLFCENYSYSQLLKGYSDSDIQLEELTLSLSQSELSLHKLLLANDMTWTLSTGSTSIGVDSTGVDFSTRPSASMTFPNLSNTTVQVTSPISLSQTDSGVDFNLNGAGISVSTDFINPKDETAAINIEKAERSSRVMGKDEQKKAAVVLGALAKIKPVLENGKPARSVELSDDEKDAIYDCHLITMKPQMYVCNVDEDGVKNGNKYIDVVKKIAEEEGSDVVVICGKFEAELAEMGSAEERAEFLGELGLKESGLAVLARAAYHLMGLRTFLTAGEDECRAWTIHAGDTAPKAAGVIHTDFEKGFIKAEVYTFDDLVKYGSEAEIKAAGKYRIEGKEYVVQDGDVIFFKFNV